MTDREPVPITEILASVLGGLAQGVDVRLGRLVEGWDEIAGPEWRGTEAIGVRDGVLLVEVDRPGRVSLLRFHVPGLVARIEEALGSGLVREVRLRVRRRADEP